MNEYLPDIPRLYTALAEWCACMVYILAGRRVLSGWRLVLPAAGILAAQSLFLELTGCLPLVYWLPCMGVAVGLMYLLLLLACGSSALDAGYTCIRAFVLAEFAASLEWQLHCFLWSSGKAPLAGALLLLVGVYLVVFLLMEWLERRQAPPSGRLSITPKEFAATVVIGVAVFAVSNLSFVSIRTPFSTQYGPEILNIRTMVDLGGLAILYAYHVQRCGLRVTRELEAVQNVLQNQYQQYQLSRESIDLINRKYHDLKHQIATLRAEPDEVRRSAYLDQMEHEIKTYEAQNKTGNQVLDTVLTSKSLYCARHDIALTCVADGKLLAFMDVMDICTVFGNALDNAIECEEQQADPEKRLIHVTVAAQRGFLLIRVENYYEGELCFDEGLPVTTKRDGDYHGYGLKSIRYVAQKYGGTARVGMQKQWFELRILIPISEG